MEKRIKPGPKPRYGNRKDYHIKLPLELVEDFEARAQQEGGMVAYIEKLVRQDLEKSERRGD